MNLLNAIDTTRITQAFSWMLIHSLWQGLLLAVVTALVLMCARKASSALRYNLVLVQFALFLAVCIYTFLLALDKGHTKGISQDFANGIAAKATGAFHIDAAGLQAFGLACVNYFTQNAPFVVLVWFVVFLFRWVKFMGGVVYMQRARHRNIVPPAIEWQHRMDVLCQKLQLKRAVQLLESGYVKVPLVMGHLKPVILMPMGLLAGLPPEQVEAVLLHELAHIRRNDYVVNLLQTIAETVFFFNPGLMWISALLREERENCCDDIALAQTQNKRGFVEALISFKEYSLSAGPYQMAFPGKKNQLLHRVSRILLNRNKSLAPAEKGFLLAGIIALSAMVSMAAVAQMKVIAQSEVKTVYASVAEQKPKTNSSARKVTRRKKQAITPGKTSLPAAYEAQLAYTLKQKREAEVAVKNTRKPKERAPLPPAAPAEISLSDAAVKLKTQAEKDNLQMKRDQEQADRDMRQSALDQLQAARDMEQARKDQIQAKLNAEQAARDQQQALRDLEQARKEQQKNKPNTTSIQL